ncbi:DUF177 domain-containing protein [Synechococcus sp. CBW1108]|uniref:YceD family protein n=1 Tax=Synechococcus sp. CBW1108 TaxID=1353147 RepID=UPI0018CE9059|nr:DUF177 domain-containing protein [Synechococcus sp. CBW1108]QPN69338.1 DUF177 domain-containing protein [Synechococcus sp. CBW1108]
MPVQSEPVPLRPLPLQELQYLDGGRHWQIGQPIAGLATLTPVRGELQATHLGNVLEVKGRAEAIVTLCCDRCLQHFNMTLSAASTELILIGAAESDDSQLVERLDPRGSFDPEHWIFEQLSLQLPIVNHCGSHCPGPATWSSASSGIDPRWQALQNLTP